MTSLVLGFPFNFRSPFVNSVTVREPSPSSRIFQTLTTILYDDDDDNDDDDDDDLHEL